METSPNMTSISSVPPFHYQITTSPHYVNDNDKRQGLRTATTHNAYSTKSSAFVPVYTSATILTQLHRRFR